MREEERKIKLDDDVARYFARFGGNLFLFVDLWEAHSTFCATGRKDGH